MRSLARTIYCSVLAIALGQGGSAFGVGADTDADALTLQSAPTPTVSTTTRDTKIFIEGAIGNSSQRYLPHSRDFGRLTFDLSYSARLGMNWRGVLSNRIDYRHPTDGVADSAVNSLREAYLSWQPEVGDTVVEFGRINLRYGPGYGYNPTDFFRDGSLRVLTSADPFALRENRLGSVMLRGQRLWNGGSASVVFSPKLVDRPDPNGWSLDLGSTNNRDRALVALGTQFSQRSGGQVLLYKQAGLSPALGANMTALLSDAATTHLEWTRSKEPDLLSRALALPGAANTRNRFVVGATYTTLGKLSVTAEYQYNGFALSKSSSAALAASPLAQVAYQREGLRLQDLASREAYLIYVTQKGLLLKELDLSAYLRFNPGDNGRLAWVELRRHWPSFDLSFQLQQHMGRATSEFGILPDRRIMQVLGTYYF